MNPNLPILIREPQDCDLGYLRSCYIAQIEERYTWYAEPKKSFNVRYNMMKGRSAQLLATNKDNPEQIFGWIFYELPDILHYIYVKRPFWGYGVAKALFLASGLKHDRVICTHWSKWAKKNAREPFYHLEIT